MDNSEQIVSMFVAGISMRKIAEHFGTTHGSISKALKLKGYTSDFRKQLDAASIISQYNEGTSASSIAKKLKVSSGVILRILNINGIDTSRIIDLDIDEITALYSEEKLSTVQIADIMECSIDTINKRLKDADIEIRSAEDCNRKYSYDESFFENIDTESKAYWLGFFIADGYVKSDIKNAGISLNIKDIDHLYKFKSDIKYDGPVREYSHMTSYGMSNYARVEITSRSFAANLISHGCIPKKTHNTEVPMGVPEEFVRHFCRGVVDGDGYIGVYDKHCTIELVGDYKLLDWMASIGPIKLKDARQHKSIWRIRTKSSETVEWLKWLYCDSTIYLDRKKIKADEAIERFSQ